MIAEIAHERPVGAENQLAGFGVNAVGANQQIGLHAAPVGKRQADPGCPVVDRRDLARIVQLHMIGKRVMQFFFDLPAQDREELPIRRVAHLRVAHLRSDAPVAVDEIDLPHAARVRFQRSDHPQILGRLVARPVKVEHIAPFPQPGGLFEHRNSPSRAAQRDGGGEPGNARA